MIEKVMKATSLFKKDIEKYFGNRVIDIIIYGSVVRGGFNSKRSDIDFLVIIDNPLIYEDIVWIKNLHTKYRNGRKLQSLLEGRYIGFIENKFSNGYNVGTKPNGWKKLSVIGYDNIESAMILDCHESLYGLDIVTWILNFNWTDINKQIHEQIDSFINSDLLLSNEKYKEYALITAARSLYTYTQKGFISKAKAKIWIEHNYLILEKNNPKECLVKIKTLLNERKCEDD